MDLAKKLKGESLEVFRKKVGDILNAINKYNDFYRTHNESENYSISVPVLSDVELDTFCSIIGKTATSYEYDMEIYNDAVSYHDISVTLQYQPEMDYMIETESPGSTSGAISADIGKRPPKYQYATWANTIRRGR
jgi:hypothetical protein